MKFILEYKSFGYNVGDIVLIHYWETGHITPVKIVEKVGNKYLISHNTNDSKIQNAPDEFVKRSEIIDLYKQSI